MEIDRFVRENRANKANGSEPGIVRESDHRTPSIQVELQESI